MHTAQSGLGLLGKALAKAVASAKGLGKDARNEHHKFRYTSSEFMIDEGRSVLSSAGLSLVQTSVTKIGDHLINIGYLLIHESGEYIAFERAMAIVENKGRPLDKSELAALTESLAYTIRGVLLIPRSDDLAGVPGAQADDVSGRDDRDYDPDSAANTMAQRHEDDAWITLHTRMAEAKDLESLIKICRESRMGSDHPRYAQMVKLFNECSRKLEPATKDDDLVTEYVAAIMAANHYDEINDIASNAWERAGSDADRARIKDATEKRAAELGKGK